ncbi:MAG: hypothetical protein QXY05_02355 [Candidatus Anstonellales archaeon]
MANHVAFNEYSIAPLKRVENAVRRIVREVGPFSFDVRFMGREGREIKKALGRYEVQCEELCKEGIAHNVLNYVWRKYRSAHEEDIYLFLLETYEKRDLLGISIILNEDGTITINDKKVGSVQRAARQKTHVISWEERDFAENQFIIAMLEDIIQNISTSTCPFYLEKLKEAHERLKRKIDPNKVEARGFIEGGLELIEKRRNWPAALFKLRAAADRLERREKIIEGKILPKAERERRALLLFLSSSMNADYLALKAIELKEIENFQNARDALLKIGGDYAENVCKIFSRIIELKEYGDNQMAEILMGEAKNVVSAHLDLLLKE